MIPVHKANQLYPGEIAVLRNHCEAEQLPIINYAHRDDYYVFIFMEKGEVKFMIDFAELQASGAGVLCILPGQVHLPLERTDLQGWFLAVDAMLISDENKSTFEKVSFLKHQPKLTADNVCELKYCAETMWRRLQRGEQFTKNSVVKSLLLTYIDMIAEIHQKGLPAEANDRCGVITSQFKTLLSTNYKTVKSPSQYAQQLNLSPVYLNEAVKKTTGLNVSDCIRKEIVTQAKRLLFYTDMCVKEIALELGYHDYAYFSRMFTRSSTLSPVQFRRKYLK
ncbi:MAG: AraC family transcriptional regulator [Prevotellaceae bacterium]|jgi:AraC-like DNA-binding protein|nr:AraC family transcriptional regulator [Prevotellaceae bacterium]